MNKQEIQSSLSKGVPNDIYIELSRTELVRLSQNPVRTRDIIQKHFEQFTERLKDLTSPIALLMDTSFTLQIFTEDTTLENKIAISPVAIEASIYLNLNVDNSYYRAERGKGIPAFQEEHAKKRVNDLKRVKSNKELEKSFPVLYVKFKELMKIKKELGENKEQEMWIRKYFSSDILEFIQQMDLSSFTKEVSNYYEILLDNKEKADSLCKEMVLDLDTLQDIDKEKLELYIATNYLSKAQEETDSNSIQKCLYYVSAYFFENGDKIDDNLSIEWLTSVANVSKKEVAITVTRKSLYEAYQELLKENPELRNITFGKEAFQDMSLEEIDQFMVKYFQDLMVHWEILPHGDCSVEQEALGKIRQISALTEEEKEEKQRRLLQLFMQKKEFYDTSNYAYRIKGRKTFDGYIGHIYPNGIVILDKYYENVRNQSLADGEAIYCMDIGDFYTLSQLGKTTLIREKLCQRFIHQGNWTKRVQEQIRNTRDGDLTTGMKKLLKKEEGK